ncbi:MAG: pilus assembly protein [Pseudonocardiales bacterium]|nr:pilus assembly protein [Pseudonocardiales bacterium]
MAEFAMISILLVFLLFAVLQVAALFYVRSVTAAAAADGARWGANADVDSSVGGARASALISKGLGGGLSARIPCTGDQPLDQASGLPTTRVHCAGHIRSVFLPLGSLIEIDVSGQALKEVR